jgi:hypothetical protein
VQEVAKTIGLRLGHSLDCHAIGALCVTFACSVFACPSPYVSAAEYSNRRRFHTCRVVGVLADNVKQDQYALFAVAAVRAGCSIRWRIEIQNTVKDGSLQLLCRNRGNSNGFTQRQIAEARLIRCNRGCEFRAGSMI